MFKNSVRTSSGSIRKLPDDVRQVSPIRSRPSRDQGNSSLFEMKQISSHVTGDELRERLVGLVPTEQLLEVRVRVSSVRKEVERGPASDPGKV